MPHFTALWRPIDVDFDDTDSFTRNIFPHPKLYANALYQIVRSFHWKNVAVIYDSDDALVRLQQTFPISYDTDYAGKTQMHSVRFHRLPDNINDYLVMLKSLKKSIISNVIVDCSLKNTETLLNLTYRVGMNDEYHVCIHKVSRFVS